MVLWGRHSGDSRWHVVGEPVGDAIPTSCNGRWPSNDEDVTYVSNPPHVERCEACQRTRIDITRIEQGLAELAANATHDEWPSAHDFDLGGES